MRAWWFQFGSRGAAWLHFGSIWGSFSAHFDDFEGNDFFLFNVCFTVVKPYFLRSWRVLCQYFFVILFNGPNFVDFLLQSEFIRGLR